MNKLTLIFLIFLCPSLYGQLIRNGDMESINSSCRTLEWETVFGSHHYIDKRYPDRLHCSAVKNRGPGYLAMVNSVPSGRSAISISSHLYSFGESMGQELSSTLEKGKKYNLSFYAAYYTDEGVPYRNPSLRFAFSKDKPFVVGRSNITEVPFALENRWQWFSYCFTVTDDSLNYLSFSTRNNVNYPNNEENPSIFFYIDDVRLDTNFVDYISIEDTVLCKGDVISVDATNDAALYYHWQSDSIPNGISNSPMLSITKSGTYISTIGNLCFIRSDTIVVRSPTAVPSDLLGNDTLICRPNELKLAYDFKDVSYQWQNGSQLSNYDIDRAGIYSVKITNVCGTTVSDSIEVSFLSKPIVSLGEDQIICKHDYLTFELDSDAGVTYLWQDSSSSNYYEVNKEGEYWVQKSNQCGVAVDTLSVTNSSIPPIVKKDSSRYYSVLSVENNVHQNYQWIYCDSTQIEDANQEELTVDLSGLYAVIATGENCIDTSACFRVIAEVERLEEVIIYPNPTYKLVNIDWKDVQEHVDIVVYDEHGKVMKKTKYDSVDHVVLNFFETMGVYFVGIKTGNSPRKYYRVVKAW